MAGADQVSTSRGEGDAGLRSTRRRKARDRPAADLSLARTGARWDQILAAGGEAFYELGFAGVRLEDVAARVGLLKGSLYYYIDSKEDLFFAVVERAHLEAVRALQDGLIPDDEPPSIRLEQFIRRWMSATPKLLPWPRGLDQDFRYLTAAQRRRIYKLRAQIVSLVETVIVDGIASREFTSEFDTAAMANIVLQILMSTERWRPPNFRVSMNELADYYWLIVARALGVAAT